MRRRRRVMVVVVVVVMMMMRRMRMRRMICIIIMMVMAIMMEMNLIERNKYTYDSQVPTGKSLQALVTNGDCGDDPSIIIAKMPGFVLCGAKTNVPKSFALPTIVRPLFA